MKFFTSLPPPLGWFNGEDAPPSAPNKVIAKTITQMNLIPYLFSSKQLTFSDANGFIYFHDVLYAAFRNGYGGQKVMSDGMLPEAIAKEESKVRKKIEKIKKKVIIKELQANNISIRLTMSLKRPSILFSECCSWV